MEPLKTSKLVKSSEYSKSGNFLPRFQLQRESSSANQKHDDDYDVVDFGDGEKVVIGAKQEPVSTVSISILILNSSNCVQTI